MSDMRSGVINPQTTRFERVSNDDFFNYSFMVAFFLPLLLGVLYSIVYGVHSFETYKAFAETDINPYHRWFESQVGIRTNQTVAFITVAPWALYVMVQLLRWMKFYVQGATFVYDRSSVWTTETRFLAVMSVFLSHSVGSLLLLLVACTIMSLVAGLLLYLATNVFNALWVVALTSIAVVFIGMTIVRSRNRKRYETQLAIEGSSHN